MKFRALGVIFFVLLSLTVVPFINFFSAPNRAAVTWNDKNSLYNLDFFARLTSRLLYPLGISIDPIEAIVGQNGWLFLGDQYYQTLTVDRRPPTSSDVKLGKNISYTTAQWNAYLSQKGVKLFRIMIGPNKGSIYPEYMPNWAKTKSPNATDTLLLGTGNEFYIDFRKPLLAAKHHYQKKLYYKFDSHWNALGASIAFHAFAQQISLTLPEIVWPPESAYKLIRTEPRPGGDLASFLRLHTYLTDSDPIINISSMPIKTTQLDYYTNKVIFRGANPAVEPPFKPLLVKSEGALNKKRVLWLRDSFGITMSPFMAATFSDVLQLHWMEGLKSPGQFIKLVEDFKPDYVFITVVERAIRAENFLLFNPTAYSRVKNFRTTHRSSIIATHDLIINKKIKNEYHVDGIDPYIDFVLKNVINPLKVKYLKINLVCDDKTTSIPLQLFWLADNHSNYDEKNSIKFDFKVNEKFIDLRTIPKWRKAKTIRRVRIDIDGQPHCRKFSLKNLDFGS